MIRLKNVTATNPRLGKAGGYMQEIATLPGLLHSFNATPDDLTMGTPPAVSAMIDRGSRGVNVSQGDTAKQPALVANQVLGKWPALKFDGGDHLLLGDAGNPDFSQPYTLVSIFRSDATAGSQRIWSAQNSTLQVSALMMTSPTNCNFRHGSGNCSATIVTDAWTLVVASSNGTGLKVSANGGPVATAATDNNVPTARLAIGASGNTASEWFKGYLSRMHMWSGDLYATEEGLRIIELYKGLAKNAYGAAIVG